VPAIEELFASGRIADVVLVVLGLEAVLLVVLPSTRAKWTRLFPMLAAGFFLALALRIALAGATWPWLAAALTGALVAHVADLRIRLRGD
jgi:hypothetical protein